MRAAPDAVGLSVALTGRTGFGSAALDRLSRDDRDEVHRGAAGTRYFIANTHLDTRPEIDLEELAGRPDPVGLLAARLLRLDRPEGDPERDRLVDQARRDLRDQAAKAGLARPRGRRRRRHGAGGVVAAGGISRAGPAAGAASGSPGRRLMHLRRLAIHALPGIEPGFTFEPAGAGINIVTGPNAIGKSSLARALQYVLARHATDPPALSLEAEFESGVARWQVTRNGNQIVWRRDGEVASRPLLPGVDRIGLFRLSVENLLDDSDADDKALAERLRRELHGNFDLGRPQDRDRAEVRRSRGKSAGRGGDGRAGAWRKRLRRPCSGGKRSCPTSQRRSRRRRRRPASGANTWLRR